MTSMSAMLTSLAFGILGIFLFLKDFEAAVVFLLTSIAIGRYSKLDF